MENILFNVDLSTIPNFETFAGSHCAYDDNGDIVWAPCDMNKFIEFMLYFFGDDYVDQSNFREGVEEWINYSTMM